MPAVTKYHVDEIIGKSGKHYKGVDVQFKTMRDFREYTKVTAKPLCQVCVAPLRSKGDKKE